MRNTCLGRRRCPSRCRHALLLPQVGGDLRHMMLLFPTRRRRLLGQPSSRQVRLHHALALSVRKRRGKQHRRDSPIAKPLQDHIQVLPHVQVVRVALVNHHNLVGQRKLPQREVPHVERAHQHLVDGAHHKVRQHALLPAVHPRGDRRTLGLELARIALASISHKAPVPPGLPHESLELLVQARLAMRKIDVLLFEAPVARKPVEPPSHAREHRVRRRHRGQRHADAAQSPTVRQELCGNQRGLRLALAHGRLDHQQTGVLRIPCNPLGSLLYGPRLNAGRQAKPITEELPKRLHTGPLLRPWRGNTRLGPGALQPAAQRRNVHAVVHVADVEQRKQVAVARQPVADDHHARKQALHRNVKLQPREPAQPLVINPRKPRGIGHELVLGFLPGLVALSAPPQREQVMAAVMQARPCGKVPMMGTNDAGQRPHARYPATRRDIPAKVPLQYQLAGNRMRRVPLPHQIAIQHEPRTLGLPGYAPRIAPAKRNALRLEHRRSLSNVMHAREEHQKGPGQCFVPAIFPADGPYDSLPRRLGKPAIPQPAGHPSGISQVHVQREPALPLAVIRLTPQRPRRRSQTSKLTGTCHDLASERPRSKAPSHCHQPT